MKTVYILIRHKPDGTITRPGVWMKRETAERHEKDWEWAAKHGIGHEGCTFEIVEEERS